jgi:DNA-binding IclR family transcriptional regulator
VYLHLIAELPGTDSTELAARAGIDRLKFKQRVRRLKSLGLTESLEVGYRLSPRGEAVLARM